MSDSASRVPISFSASDLIMVTDACEPGFTPQAARCSASCKIPFRSIIKTRQISSGFYGGETGICSCLLQSSPCKIFLCFAKAFGQPLKTTHRVVFLTLSFKSLLLSIEKQNGQASLLVRFVWRRNRDLNPGYAPHVLLP